MTVKSRLLELLEQHKGETLSGEAIAGELSCTRAAVWKAVKALREEGYEIEAGQNRGYMLARETNRLSAEGIRPYLRSQEVCIQFLAEVDSTNRAARQAVLDKKAGHGSFVIAQRQTAGRGRRGRSFFSPEDSGIYLSVILEPSGNLGESLFITTAAATAVYKAVKEVCAMELDIKWVNDLYLHGRKVCGILTEAITDFESGDIEAAVVGIGLNLYTGEAGFPPELQDIAGALYSSKEEAGRVSCNLLAASVVNHLLEETETPGISREYVERNMIPGHEILIRDGSRSRRAWALSIGTDGRLLVKEEDGTQHWLSYGEVSVSGPLAENHQ